MRSQKNETRPACLASTRNNEAPWNPAIVVFPLTAAHVVASVTFARKHNLCVSVLGISLSFLLLFSPISLVFLSFISHLSHIPPFGTGTGHDFMNRHDGCPDGMLIRTTCMSKHAHQSTISIACDVCGPF